MPPAAKHDPDAGHEPAFPAPKNACDAHFHIFGAEDRYPYFASDLRYKPPHEPLDAYLKLARRIGFVRFVLVQPSAYGFDNSCMFDAMRELDEEQNASQEDDRHQRQHDGQHAEQHDGQHDALHENAEKEWS